MTIYDFVIIFIILGFAISGFFKGFICEVFEIAGIIIGILAGRALAPTVAGFLPAKAPLFIRMPLSVVFVSVIVFFLVKIVGWLIQKMLIHGPLKMLNRLAGVAVGFIQGALVVAFVLMLLAMTPLYKRVEQTRQDSPVLDYSIIISKPIIKRYQALLFKNTDTIAVKETSSPLTLSALKSSTLSANSFTSIEENAGLIGG